MSYEGLSPELAGEVLTVALKRGGELAELYVEERSSLSLRLEDGRVEQAVTGVDRGASLRVVRGVTTVFGYVDAVNEADLLGLATELGGSAAGQREAIVVVREAEASGKRRPPEPERRSAHTGARLLHLVDESARAVSREVCQVVASYGESRQRVWIAGSYGALAVDDRYRVIVSVTVTAQRDGLLQTAQDSLAYVGASSSPGEDAVRGLAEDVAKRAVTLLDSRPAPAGRMPVVLANGFGGVLFHEACGHGLEADHVLKQSSVWAGMVGQRVAGEHVFAYDDGSLPGIWGSCSCDDEGVTCGRTVLIEAGVLTGYLTDRLRARRLDLGLTGNGRRQDYRHLPYPRMTNTFIGAGKHKAAELIGDTPYGLYARSFSGGQVNPATGEFVFGVSEAYLIEKGRLTAPVRGATLIGSGPQILLAIDAIADDLEIKAGMCGKEGQSVPVGTGQPTLRIREMTVGGTAA